MRRIVISEEALRQRDEIAAQRNRYYQARADGFSREEANEIANGAEAPAPVVVAQPDGEILIPDNWAALPYLPRAKGGPSLRGLATKLSAQPVKNAAEATAAIEAELARRAEA
ncbi:hypothetical protein [Mesorhizobium sp. M0058]|uniref:hypothetical protein n=1 Tax=Mesorhizobium sp. M0058 TaxID=2956865 RepID=UPI0033367A82